MDKELKFAILIDADNISEKYIKIILDETPKAGSPPISGSTATGPIPSLIPEKGPFGQLHHPDSAVRLHHGKELHGLRHDHRRHGYPVFRDCGRLLPGLLGQRLYQAGREAQGIGNAGDRHGREQDPQALYLSLQQFKYLDILFSTQKEESAPAAEPEEEQAPASVKKEKSPAKKAKPQTNLKTIKKAILSLVEECSDDDGWIFSAELGNQLAKRFPDFDVRNFGFSKFTPFISSLGLFEIKRNQASSNSNVQLVYFKLKDKKR